MGNGRKVVKDPETGKMRIVARKQPPRRDKVFRRLEASVPRDEWIQALGTSGDERAIHLMERMLDPNLGRASLPRLAADVGLTYAQALQIITKHRLGQGLLRMSAHVPQVLEDVAVDSKSREVTCGSCRGYKVGGIAVVAITESVHDPDTKRNVVVQKLDDEGRPMWERCLTCDGTGTLRKVGDADARKLLFETMKLTGRNAPLVVQQFNAAGASMEDAVASVADAIDVTPAKGDS